MNQVIMYNSNKIEALKAPFLYVKDHNNDFQCLTIIKDKFSMFPRKKDTSILFYISIYTINCRCDKRHK